MQKFRILDHAKCSLVLSFVFAALAAAENYSQLKLPLKKISFCGHEYMAWVAKSSEERTKGLMDFRPLKAHEAMIFIFENEEPLNFWMKNVPYDLDIAYFSKAKKLVANMTMRGTSPMMNEMSLPTYSSGGPSSYAVEVAGGSLGHLKENCRLAFN